MRCGLFGKLPAKRDFIAVAAPREFLNPWERWLQGGLSASRASLGAGWQAAFLSAPIWRFWLGADVCGRSALGAFMPSVDEVGRYFPLTLVACSTEDAVPPPELDPQEAWFAAAESLLLAALDAPPFAETAAALERLPPPAILPPDAGEAGARRLPGGGLLVAAEPGLVPERLAALRRLDPEQAYAACSFWWTAGGAGYPALAVAARRLPDPYLFASMLTGSFERHGG